MQNIEFLYDFGSPNAYLVHKVLPGLAERYGASVTYVPILLGGVFKATDNQSPIQAFANVKGKLAYQAREIERFVTRHGIKYHMNPHFPVNTIGIMRGAVYSRGKPWEGTYIDAIYNAMWIHGQKMDDTDVIADVLETAGLPYTEILAATQDAEVKQGLIDATSAAVARGTFGSPTLFLGDEMFFGKDSLPELEHYLSGAA
ncbi:2-hydroxychromene-2-carboxylate isomerase [Seohaeicola saemankumensis]|nr:2-hydroxychromene-2-carboxylate isomerase [Seohaeicola saemankumensis]MCA0873364.1 2-hydroxychromene-2-carboxylate isomerase [Seohaeicola saemankumensis]